MSLVSRQQLFTSKIKDKEVLIILMKNSLILISMHDSITGITIFGNELWCVNPVIH